MISASDSKAVPSPSDAWELLSPSLSPQRRDKLIRAASLKTKHIRLVIQDVHHPHNVSACLRSAEAFGLLDVDIVNLKEKFNPSTVARGVSGWLNINVHKSIKECTDTLHAQGYKIAAAFPRPDVLTLDKVSIEEPLAVVFGNEHAGVHEEWAKHIDYAFTIPMFGMVESLNISVSCAITLHHLSSQLRENLNLSSVSLDSQQQKQLLSEWVCQHFPRWKLQLERERENRAKLL